MTVASIRARTHARARARSLSLFNSSDPVLAVPDLPYPCTPPVGVLLEYAGIRYWLYRIPLVYGGIRYSQYRIPLVYGGIPLGYGEICILASKNVYRARVRTRARARVA